MKKSTPIKGLFFDEIRRGVKDVEYRENTERNRAIFCDKELTHIVFHQYRADRLECRVKSVKVIKVPKAVLHLWQLVYPGQKDCIAIKISHPRYYVDMSGKSKTVLWA